jgi:hypothetical protein
MCNDIVLKSTKSDSFRLFRSMGAVPFTTKDFGVRWYYMGSLWLIKSYMNCDCFATGSLNVTWDMLSTRVQKRLVKLGDVYRG